MNRHETVIIGGGVGGLVAAYLLASAGQDVVLVEKRTYPFHRVCGEYVSNEVRSFMQSAGLFPEELFPAEIRQFRLSSVSGKVAEMPLDMGGFGISRYALDHFLYQKARHAGATFILNTQVEAIQFKEKEDCFELALNNGESLVAKNALGAFGKRSKIDKALSRKFFYQRTPYIGVKYHIKTAHETDMIALHNFHGGYCGINCIENQHFSLCYLGDKRQLRKYGSLPEMEKNILFQNPYLKDLFENAEFLLEKPEVINEISFASKGPLESHVLMVGDAAGMITPLCGNGMAIAIHSGKLAAEALLENHTRAATEQQYVSNWSRFFKNRLVMGRVTQRLFGSKPASEITVGLMRKSSFMARKIMKLTHGNRV